MLYPSINQSLFGAVGKAELPSHFLIGSICESLALKSQQLLEGPNRAYWAGTNNFYCTISWAPVQFQSLNVNINTAKSSNPEQYLRNCLKRHNHSYHPQFPFGLLFLPPWCEFYQISFKNMLPFKLSLQKPTFHSKRKLPKI